MSLLLPGVVNRLTRCAVWLPVLPLALLVLFAFAPAIGNDFVRYDDHENFIDNVHFGPLSIAGIRWAGMTTLLGVYQPLSWLLLELQATCFGLHPPGYHLASILLHLANTLLFYRLALVLLRRFDLPAIVGAGLAAALFGVHPLAVEVVAWASAQTYLPAVLFALLAMLAYLKAFPANKPEQRHWRWMAWGLYTLAALSRASVMMLPIAFLIMDRWVLGRWTGVKQRNRCLREKLLPLGVLLGVAAIAFLARTQRAPLAQDGLPLRLAWSMRALAFYLEKAAWPLDLTFHYYANPRHSWMRLDYVAAAVAVVGLTVFLILKRGKWPLALAAWLAYLALLAPSSGVVRSGTWAMADRYGYFPLLAFWLLLAGGVAWLAARRSTRWPIGVLGLAAVSLLTWQTRHQCRLWSDTPTLIAHALRHGGRESPELWAVQGQYLFEQGQTVVGKQHLEEALRLDPESQRMRLAFGQVCLLELRHAEALEHLRVAQRHQPQDAWTHYYLGVALAKTGNDAEAIHCFSQALAIKPNLVEAHHERGVALARLGQMDAALEDIRLALRDGKDRSALHHAVGFCLLQLGQLTEAEGELQEALRLAPALSEAHHDFAVLLERRGQTEAALAQYRTALAHKPAYVEAYCHLGLALLGQSRLVEAEANLQAALRLRPKLAEAHNGLGMLRVAQGHPNESLLHFREAVRLQPGRADWHFNLARALAETGSTAEARSEREAAESLDLRLAISH